jgi:hypothetical protein
MANNLDAVKAAAATIPESAVKGAAAYKDGMTQIKNFTTSVVGGIFAATSTAAEMLADMTDGVDHLDAIEGRTYAKKMARIAEVRKAEQDAAAAKAAEVAAAEAAAAAEAERIQISEANFRNAAANRMMLASIGGKDDKAARIALNLGESGVREKGGGDLNYGMQLIEAEVAAAERAAEEKAKAAQEVKDAEIKAAEAAQKAVEEAKKKEVAAAEKAAADKIKAIEKEEQARKAAANRAASEARTAADAAKNAAEKARDTASKSRDTALLSNKALREAAKQEKEQAREKEREDKKIRNAAASAKRKLGSDLDKDNLTLREKASLKALRDQNAATKAGGLETLATKQLERLTTIADKIDKMAGTAP